MNFVPAPVNSNMRMTLIPGKTIGLFFKYLEILNLTMYIFKQFIFPLSPNENVSGLSSTKFFCSENIEQFIVVGFMCGYDELETLNPFRELKTGEYRFLSEEEEKKGLDLQLFKCDYILDLVKKILKEQDKYIYGSEIENNKKQNLRLNEYFKKVLSSNSSNSYLETYISRLYSRLKEISYKLKSYQHNSGKLPKFFESS